MVTGAHELRANHANKDLSSWCTVQCKPPSRSAAVQAVAVLPRYLPQH